MPTRRQLIQKITLNANSNSITFSNIPQNYTDLKVFVSARATGSYDATPWVTASFRFNGSSSGYTARTLFGTGSASGSDSNTGGPLLIPDTDSTSGTFGNSNVYIPNYSSSSITKSLIATSVTENNGTSAAMWNYAMSWSNTSPITSIQITSGAGDLAANSTFYLYGITHVPIIRGGEVSVRDGFKYHTFKSTASLQVIEPGDVEYLVVAGGGGGGSDGGRGGGGGGGGVLVGRTRINTGNTTMTIGAGGVGGLFPSIISAPGIDSSLGSLVTASGGGRGGGSHAGGSTLGGNGGSGGGGAGNVGTIAGGTGISGQGNNGGSGRFTSGVFVGGGGGGAAAVGGESVLGTYSGGNGGAGRLVWDNYYGGGGGGGAAASSFTEVPGSGGIGGGGRGISDAGTDGSSGSPNTGGGGGGGSNAGGSGIVIIRYPYDGN